MEIKKYQSKFSYSYSLGMAPTLELIKYKKEHIYKIYIHENYRQEDDNVNIFDVCKKNNIIYEVNKRIINKISNKSNIYVVGVFTKYKCHLDDEKPHVILVNPSNTGNLGTILRTGLGFNLNNFAIITPSVDIFNPNTIRSSMGAVFRTNFFMYDDVENYLKENASHKLYSFMLNGEYNIKNVPLPKDSFFTLVFGNEATGLPEKFLKLGNSLYINHNNKIDSLNLAIAFGIAANHFSNN